MPPAPEVKGWCPGAFAPMRSNDGLLIRAKLVGSRIDAEQLDALAAISQDCGNGLVDLSQRAQLQLRGVSDATLTEALRRLDAVGLLARDADAERVTNIVASPLTGLNGGGAFDANALARELAEAIQADTALRALPAKFLFAVDDGGAPPLADVAADIRIDACADGVAISVAGAAGSAILADMSGAVPTAVKLARAFVALRDGAFETRRMKRLVGAIGLDALLETAGVRAFPHSRPTPKQPSAFLGARAIGGASVAGVAAFSGRFHARELARLAACAGSDGKSQLRLTPWRALLLPAESEAAALRVIDAARALDLIVSHDDPRLAVVACPGAPECPQAQGETRTHLARLASVAQKLAGADGVGLHLSGCAKGCARPGSSAVTLIANGGLFDYVEDGRASDAPRLPGLTIDAAERALIRRAREKTCPTP